MALELLKKEQSGLASAFGELMENHAAKEPAWLRLRREKSFAGFEAKGLPTVKDEDWKYTNLAAIARTNFAPVLSLESKVDLKDSRYEEMRDSTLVFVNGVFQKEISSLEGLPGVVITTFTDALASGDHEDLIREHYARDWNDPVGYHMVLNTERLGYEGTVAIIVAEAGRRGWK